MAATTERGWSEGLRAQEELVAVQRPDRSRGNAVMVAAISKRRSNRGQHPGSRDQAERGCCRTGKGRRELMGA